MPIHPDLLDIVRCPKCHGRVAERAVAGGPGLVCETCRLVYPVVDEIPNFLIDEAQPLK
jgi:uncharacterized protein YbaR (Trm112 family)